MKIFLTLVLMSSYFSCFAQEGNLIEQHKERKREQRELAAKNIELLSTSALFVRLDFKSKEVAYYEKHNNQKEADKIRKRQLKINLAITEAFEKRFSFCPVYYFAMKDSKRIVDNQMEDLVFYTSNCGVSDSIKFEEKDFFIGEFGTVEQDADGRKTSVIALVIRDANFNQLADPFPYYEKLFPFAFIKSRYRSSVLKLNAKLIAFKEKMDQEKNQ